MPTKLSVLRLNSMKTLICKVRNTRNISIIFFTKIQRVLMKRIAKYYNEKFLLLLYYQRYLVCAKKYSGGSRLNQRKLKTVLVAIIIIKQARNYRLYQLV